MAKVFGFFEAIKYRLKLGKKNFNALKEYIGDLISTDKFKSEDITVKIGKNKASISGLKLSPRKIDEVFSAKIDFAANTVEQKRSVFSRILSPFLPNQKDVEIINGTLDGKIFTARTLNLRSNDYGRGVAILKNEKTGSTYRRTTGIDPIRKKKKVVYEKLVDGKYVYLFPKK